MLLSHALTLYASQFVHKKKSLRIYDGEPGVVASVSPLSNGRLCAGAYEKIPRTFAQSVGLFNKISIASPVCPLTFALARRQASASLEARYLDLHPPLLASKAVLSFRGAWSRYVL